MTLENLIDSITGELFEDPITLPCGHTFSRDSVRQHFRFSNTQSCPLCRVDLSYFDIETAARAFIIADMVEKFQNQNIEKSLAQDEPLNNLNLKAHMYPISDASYKTRVAKLEITSDENIFKTLVIAVIDISGSMTGNPINQAKYSLNRIVDLSYQNKSNITNIITYNDNFKIIEIDTKLQEFYYRTLINNLVASGGTLFSSAFKGICQTIDKFKDQENISSITVIFLTDGEDSSVHGDKRITLVDKLRNDILTLTNKPITIHSVGFGMSHDYNFLNNLRTACIEGCYKYANPSEDLDSLSNKINSIVDIIMNSSYVPLKIVDNINIIHDYRDNTYFINITKNMIDCLNIQVNEQVINLPILLEEENNERIKNSWYSYLIDQIAQEIILLSEVDINVLDNKVHIELLEKRCKAIMIRIHAMKNQNNLEKLSKLLVMIQNIKKNIKVDKLKLVDMATEGRYISAITLRPNVIQMTDLSTPMIVINKTPKTVNKLEYIDRHKIKKNILKNISKELFFNISQCSNSKASTELNKNLNQIDDLIVFCSSIGRINLVNYLLGKQLHDINYTLHDGYNALDYALLNGFWMMGKILLDLKMLPTVNKELLFKSCLKYNYFKTLKMLIDEKIVFWQTETT